LDSLLIIKQDLGVDPVKGKSVLSYGHRVKEKREQREAGAELHRLCMVDMHRGQNKICLQFDPNFVMCTR
jgi:hypothetical protein